MAHAPGMRVVAERVETENQTTVLRSRRCVRCANDDVGITMKIKFDA
jgi:sensor c-di-GMP phosphodiesterase-like protein